MSRLFDMKPRLILATFVLPLGLIIALVPENKTKPYRVTIEQLLSQVTEGAQYVSTDQIADLIVQKDPSIQLIDVRPAAEYEKFHLPGAINIPLSNILADEYRDYLDQYAKTNVFYSNGTVNANQAWTICTQLGYKNNYVMQGGLNYWAETIMNPQEPKQTAPDDEFAKYDFRKGMNQALGGGTLEAAAPATDSKPALPAIAPKPKKKRVSGGC